MIKEEQYTALANAVTHAMKWEFWSLESFCLCLVYLFAPAHGAQFLVILNSFLSVLSVDVNAFVIGRGDAGAPELSSSSISCRDTITVFSEARASGATRTACALRFPWT
jgi:hypothetical protein